MIVRIESIISTHTDRQVKTEDLVIIGGPMNNKFTTRLFIIVILS